MKRIGILGGTFNPIHIGHLAIAQSAQERFDLEKVYFVPSHRPPHRKITNLAAPRQRYEMVRLAIKGNPFFDVSDFEIKREGKSYTIDTVRYFRETYSDKVKLFFIIGEDNFSDLKTWKNIEDILETLTFIVVNRPGYEHAHSNIKHLMVNMPGIELSASYIRRSLSAGKSIKYLVSDNVFRYIKRHKLYQT